MAHRIDETARGLPTEGGTEEMTREGEITSEESIKWNEASAASSTLYSISTPSKSPSFFSSAAALSCCLLRFANRLILVRLFFHSN